MFVAVPFRQGRGGGGIMDRLGFVFLSKDGPNVEEGREKLNSEKIASAVKVHDRESADAGSISGTAAKLPDVAGQGSSRIPTSPPSRQAAGAPALAGPPGRGSDAEGAPLPRPPASSGGTAWPGARYRSPLDSHPRPHPRGSFVRGAGGGRAVPRGAGGPRRRPGGAGGRAGGGDRR